MVRLSEERLEQIAKESRTGEVIKYTGHLIPGYTTYKWADKSLNKGLAGIYIDLVKLGLYYVLTESFLK